MKMNKRSYYCPHVPYLAKSNLGLACSLSSETHQEGLSPWEKSKGPYSNVDLTTLLFLPGHTLAILEK